MKMNMTRRHIIAIGLLINALLGLYPPWAVTLGSGEGSLKIHTGFYFLFRPPVAQDLVKQMPAKQRSETGIPSQTEIAIRYSSFFPAAIQAEVNLKILFIEWILVGFVVAAFVVWFGKK